MKIHILFSIDFFIRKDNVEKYGTAKKDADGYISARCMLG
jgi:hypothetical protein